MTYSPRRTRAATALLCFGIISLAACVVDVDGPDECIFAYEIDPGPISVNVADSTTVRAIPVANCGGPQSVTWRVEDATKATVRSTGNLTAVVRGVVKGTTFLHAENGDKSGFELIDVK
jgi:hypothetical protein